MSDPFIGEIRQNAFDFVPQGWASCDGSLVQIRSYTALFSILGVQYGGDGRTTFALPDLRGRFPAGAGRGAGLSAYGLGESGGAANVTLTTAQMPTHSHTPQATSARGDRESPTGATWAQPHYGRGSEVAYAKGEPTTTMSPAALAPTGGGMPHDNMSPYLVLNYVIALTGVFPQRP